MSRPLLVLLLVVATAACAPAPDTLRVERVLTGTAIGQFDPFDRTVRDATVVRELDAMIRGLPAAPPNRFCPISWGHRYRLTFTSGAVPTLVVTVEADGCREAYLGPTDRRDTTESFWARLAGALGFYTRGNDLFPLPRDMRR